MSIMFASLSANGLITALTTGNLCDKKILSITTSMVNSNMPMQEAINEQLDIIFDEVLLTNPSLSKKKGLLEKSLRAVESSWKSRLEKS